MNFKKNFKNTLAILEFASDTYNNEKPDKNYWRLPATWKIIVGDKYD